MAGSFTCLHFHLIFSTKHREPLLSPDLQRDLFPIIGGILRAKGSSLIAAGGMPDHVHLLTSLSKQVSIADALRDIKANSSRWIHQHHANQRGFAWQDGDCAFAVSYSHLEKVKEYIATQAEHHRVKTFQEEFVEFLTRHGIEFDEAYLWE